MPRYQQTYYLSDEASALRIEALVARLAADPADPANGWVPESIRRQVLSRRETDTERKAA